MGFVGRLYMEGEKMSEFCQRCLLCLLSLMPIFICSFNNIRRLHHISEKERFSYFTFTYSAVHYSAPSSASEIDLFSLPFPKTGIPTRHAALVRTAQCPFPSSMWIMRNLSLAGNGA